MILEISSFQGCKSKITTRTRRRADHDRRGRPLPQSPERVAAVVMSGNSGGR